MSSASFNNIPTKIVLLGNPGVGKSTIFNTLLNRVRSPSGVSIGKGLTQHAYAKCSGDFVCVDTPGLDDVYNTNNSLREISRAMMGPCRVKLVFVITLEAGRVRSGDLAALATILDGISHLVGNVDHKYLLIINKCERSVYKALSKHTTRENVRVLAPFRALGGVSRFVLLRFESSAWGKQNVLLQNTNVERLREAIEATPAITLPHNPILNLDISHLQKNKKEVEHEIKVFYRTFDSVIPPHVDTSRQDGQRGNSENCSLNLVSEVVGERRVGRFTRGMKKLIEILLGLQPLIELAEVVCGFVLMFL